MEFSFRINLKLFNIESVNDEWNLINLFDDNSLYDFINDSEFSKYIYFIKEDNNIIGFVYLMQFKNSDIYNLEYGLKKDKLNKNYIYTLLTLIRDEIKSKHLDKIMLVSRNEKGSKYNEVASLFGKLIYSGDFDYYEINPNCENLEEENIKIKKYLENVVCR